MSETWTVGIAVTVHGVWKPDHEQACAELIAAVNALRSPDNERPCIRRGWWSNDDKPWLDLTIGATSMRLDAGDHLVSIALPGGETEWVALDDDDLDKLRPLAVSR